MEPIDDRGRTVTIIPQPAPIEPVPNNKLHPEWPPPTIVKWIQGGCVSTDRLATELNDWLDYFRLSPEEWSARWYLREQ